MVACCMSVSVGAVLDSKQDEMLFSRGATARALSDLWWHEQVEVVCIS